MKRVLIYGMILIIALILSACPVSANFMMSMPFVSSGPVFTTYITPVAYWDAAAQTFNSANIITSDIENLKLSFSQDTGAEACGFPIAMGNVLQDSQSSLIGNKCYFFTDTF